jgi:hypothetical protein
MTFTKSKDDFDKKFGQQIDFDCFLSLTFSMGWSESFSLLDLKMPTHLSIPTGRDFRSQFFLTAKVTPMADFSLCQRFDVCY